MAELHGQISRHGITLQSHRRPSIGAGWLGDYMQSSLGRRTGWASEAINANGQNRPIWASQLLAGDEIFIHDIHRGYTRYPRRFNRTLQIDMDTSLSGKFTHFTVDCSVANPARKSHRGLDKGAIRGNLSVRVRAWQQGGSLILDWGQVSNQWGQGVFDGNRISGWTGYWYPWSRHFNLGVPIGRVLINARVITGKEDIHSEGDGSQWGGWNPWHPIGAHYQYNYFDLIGINEGHKAHGNSEPNGIELNRRVDVINGQENTISWNKYEIPY